LRLPAVRRTTVAAFGALLLTALVQLVEVAPQAATAASGPSAEACPTPSKSVLRSTPATSRRTVALTFDDGPSAFTPAVLDVLKRERVHATFFVTGAHVRASPATARRIVAEGHVLGNHTYSHPQPLKASVPYGSFSGLSAATQASQMDTTTREIVAATATRPCFFRAPGGAHFATSTVGLARGRGMAVVHWSNDTEDWRQPGSSAPSWQNRIYSRSVSPLYAHPIILMHDGKASADSISPNRTNTVAALTRTIRFYKARGYVFTDPAGRRL
jgi:peptidoglycan/xylan/chitin deacetylase (PgdA/CDA1 family)